MAVDQLSINKLNQLHPAIKQDALDAYDEACRLTPKGVHPVIDETDRSFERSTALYNQPTDGKDNDRDGKIDEPDEKVSNAKAGQSYHNYKLALDFYLLINGKRYYPADEKAAMKDKNWMIVVNAFKKRGFTWGGEFPGKFKDAPHLQKTLGYSVKQLLALHNAGKFIPGGTFVNV